MEHEVHPYAPDAYIDEKKTQIGYEVSFTKYFYKPIELSDVNEIKERILRIETEVDGMLSEIIGG